MSLERSPLFLDFQRLSIHREMQHQHFRKRWWCNHAFMCYTREHGPCAQHEGPRGQLAATCHAWLVQHGNPNYKNV